MNINSIHDRTVMGSANGQAATTHPLRQNGSSYSLNFEVDQNTGNVTVKVLNDREKIIRVLHFDRTVDISTLERKVGSLIDGTF